MRGDHFQLPIHMNGSAVVAATAGRRWPPPEAYFFLCLLIISLINKHEGTTPDKKAAEFSGPLAALSLIPSPPIHSKKKQLNFRDPKDSQDSQGPQAP